jgi:hypothetical protein
MKSDGVLESVTGRVAWIANLELREGNWYIRVLVVKPLVPLDNPEVMQKSHKKVEEGFVRGGKP